MAPLPTELKLQTHVDVACARCQHNGSSVTITLPLLGATMHAGQAIPVVDVQVANADVAMECDQCHQSVIYRDASLLNDFDPAAFTPAEGAGADPS